jgi:uncharacterized protein
LLFIDFESGDLLQLQGTVTIDWKAETAIAGAQRLWRMEVAHGWRHANAVPFAWTFGEYAPTTLATGAWPINSAA